jgi:hypothetical protein
MSFYTVQIQPPVSNWSDPSTPILWHLAVAASSQADALAVVARGDFKGMPAKIVPPLGFACRADLSWDLQYEPQTFE